MKLGGYFNFSRDSVNELPGTDQYGALGYKQTDRDYSDYNALYAQLVRNEVLRQNYGEQSSTQDTSSNEQQLGGYLQFIPVVYYFIPGSDKVVTEAEYEALMGNKPPTNTKSQQVYVPQMYTSYIPTQMSSKQLDSFVNTFKSVNIDITKPVNISNDQAERSLGRLREQIAKINPEASSLMSWIDIKVNHEYLRDLNERVNSPDYYGFGAMWNASQLERNVGLEFDRKSGLVAGDNFSRGLFGLKSVEQSTPYRADPEAPWTYGFHKFNPGKDGGEYMAGKAAGALLGQVTPVLGLAKNLVTTMENPLAGTLGIAGIAIGGLPGLILSALPEVINLFSDTRYQPPATVKALDGTPYGTGKLQLLGDTLSYIPEVKDKYVNEIKSFEETYGDQIPPEIKVKLDQIFANDNNTSPLVKDIAPIAQTDTNSNTQILNKVPNSYLSKDVGILKDVTPNPSLKTVLQKLIQGTDGKSLPSTWDQSLSPSLPKGPGTSAIPASNTRPLVDAIMRGMEKARGTATQMSVPLSSVKNQYAPSNTYAVNLGDRGTVNIRQDVAQAIDFAAKETGLPSTLLFGVVAKESMFNPNAVAKANNRYHGLTQVGKSAVYDVARFKTSELINSGVLPSKYNDTKAFGGKNGQISAINSYLWANRYDPKVNALTGALYMKQAAEWAYGKQAVENGRLTPGQIYAAHNIGAGGARALSNASPNTLARDVVTATKGLGRIAYEQNKGIYQGTVSEVFNNFDRTIEDWGGSAIDQLTKAGALNPPINPINQPRLVTNIPKYITSVNIAPGFSPTQLNKLGISPSSLKTPELKPADLKSVLQKAISITPNNRFGSESAADRFTELQRQQPFKINLPAPNMAKLTGPSGYPLTASMSPFIGIRPVTPSYTPIKYPTYSSFISSIGYTPSLSYSDRVSNLGKNTDTGRLADLETGKLLAAMGLVTHGGVNYNKNSAGKGSALPGKSSIGGKSKTLRGGVTIEYTPKPSPISLQDISGTHHLFDPQFRSPSYIRSYMENINRSIVNTRNSFAENMAKSNYNYQQMMNRIAETQANVQRNMQNQIVRNPEPAVWTRDDVSSYFNTLKNDPELKEYGINPDDLWKNGGFTDSYNNAGYITYEGRRIWPEKVNGRYPLLSLSGGYSNDTISEEQFQQSHPQSKLNKQVEDWIARTYGGGGILTPNTAMKNVLRGGTYNANIIKPNQAMKGLFKAG